MENPACISLEQAAPLLERDVSTTLGAGWVGMVRLAVSDADPDNDHHDGQWLVDRIQQDIHDDRVDTSWPRCPLHRHHPLWLNDGVWWCRTTGTPIANLGELTAASAWTPPNA